MSRGNNWKDGDLGFAKRPEMDFAEEALRALGDDHFHSVGHVIGGENFRGIFRAARGKICGHTAGTDHTDANAMFAKVFGHAGGKAL
jgi:hypothetical protein